MVELYLISGKPAGKKHFELLQEHAF